MLARIGTDPEGIKHTLAKGARFWNGLAMAGGRTYYGRIWYSHISGSNRCFILKMRFSADSGPH